MPMSKERKAEYNKEHYQQKKLGILRPVQIPKPPVSIQGSVRPDPAKLAKLRKLMERPPEKETISESTPWYVPGRRYPAGTQLRVKRGNRVETITAPEIDAEGQAVW